ncbi:sugar phosphate isomerase/epimerase [Sphingomonas rhizophila]|uniref:Sugar phosphate isomerase/epimerase n=1 Tax=Sphingomonas rhizophila TaxID=2071607 RepID=A0A7G9SBD5_9SPHN|nr:sugar phosphate isomerase/epimerase [Sphingomonas rhizophila]QNN65160.1 sugar phosphate isomerase/epimerase [Sphingomonas rhizophila]
MTRFRLCLAALLVAAAPPAAPARMIVGAQLYTARDALARDLPGTLGAIRQSGYRDVEVAGVGQVPAARLRRSLDRAGLRAHAFHADWKLLRDTPASVFTDARILGARFVVLAWLPPEERATAAQWRVWVARLNRLGLEARRRGLRMAYHPHDFEFGQVDGIVPFDLLRDGLDQRLVDFEIDVYWAAKAGRDPVALVRSLGRRTPLLHLKDIDCRTRAFADVGDGCLNWPALMRAARAAGVTHAYIERDDPQDAVRSLDRGRRFLVRKGLR